MGDGYVLKRGHLGALRLGVLAQAAGPGTTALLDRLPWKAGWRCLDVGCGLGFVARELTRRGGRTTAVDSAAEYIEAARQGGGADFFHMELRELAQLGEKFQLICARYVLSHQADPQQAVAIMAAQLLPGGYLVLEDVDFPGHVCYPGCPAFERYLELYQQCARLRGGNARLGRQLWELVEAAGLNSVHVGLNQPLHRHGPEQRVAELTLSHIGGALREFGLCGRGELAGLLRELRQWRRSAGVVSLAPTHQVIAQQPS